LMFEALPWSQDTANLPSLPQLPLHFPYSETLH